MWWPFRRDILSLPLALSSYETRNGQSYNFRSRTTISTFTCDITACVQFWILPSRREQLDVLESDSAFDLAAASSRSSGQNPVPVYRVRKQTLPTIWWNFRTFLPIDSGANRRDWMRQRGPTEKRIRRRGDNPAMACQTIENVHRKCSAAFMRGRAQSTQRSRYYFGLRFVELINTLSEVV